MGSLVGIEKKKSETAMEKDSSEKRKASGQRNEREEL